MISLLNEISSRWYSYLVTSSLQLVFFFVLVLFLALIFRNRSARFLYALWSLVLVKALLPPSLPFPFPIRKSIDFLPQVMMSPLPSPSVVADPGAGLLQLQTSGYFFLIWLVAVAGLFGFLLWKNLRFHLQLRKAVAFDVSLLPRSIQIRLQRLPSVAVYLVDGLYAPFTFYLLHPGIFLPSEAAGWSSQKLEAVLMHELAHVQRKDLWVNLLQNIVQVAYFFHPLIWFANWQINNYRERTCDDYAIFNLKGYSLEYSKYLLAHLDSSLQRGVSPALSHYFFQNKKAVLKRFEYLIKRKEGIMLKLKSGEKLILTFLSLLIAAIVLANSGIPEALSEPPFGEERVATISGKVTTRETGEALPGANVVIEGTNLGAATSLQGEYVIHNVPPGRYTLIARMIGFLPETVADVVVGVDKINTVNFSLRVDRGGSSANGTGASRVMKKTQLPVVEGGAKIIGKIKDKATGEVIPGANIILKGTRLGSASSPTGDYAIQNIPPGKYSLQVRMLGYKPVTIDNITLSDEQILQTNVALEGASVSTQVQSGEAQEKLFVPYDVPPKPVGGFSAMQRNVVYPESARRAGVEGTVILQVLVDEHGSVTKVRVARSIGNRECDEAAIAAIKATDWEPALQRDKPVKVWVSIPVRFRAQNRSGASHDQTPQSLKINVRSAYPGQSVFQPYDKPPEPIGGFAALQKNLHYPELARRAGIQGTVIVQCVIDETGQVVETKVAKSLGANNGCDQAAAAAIASTRWRPALLRDKPVKVRISVPVIFKLKEEVLTEKDTLKEETRKMIPPLPMEKQITNYPNPFNPSTTIHYTVPHPARVTITIYNVDGQVIRTLLDREQEPGNYNVQWDGLDQNLHRVASGQYFYQIKIGDKVFAKKMLKIQ